MHRHRKLAKRALCPTALALISIGMSPTPSSAWEWVAGPPKTEVRPWSFDLNQQPAGKRAIRFQAEADYCSGEKRPFIHHVGIVESGKRVVIRAFVRWPEPLEVSGPVEPGEATPGCADLVAVLHRRVRLGQTKQNAKLFDGYYSPPKRVMANLSHP